MRRLAGVLSAVVVAVSVCPALVHAGYDITHRIALTKTVGLSPEICSTSTQIVVQPGTNATYCYLIVNTGLVSSMMHTLIDDHLGDLTPDLPGSPPGTFFIAPGESQFILKTVQINASVTNVATVTAIFSDTDMVAHGSATGPPALPQTVTATAVGSAAVIVAAKSVAPTVSSAGLAVIALALLVVGGLRLTRARRDNA